MLKAISTHIFLKHRLHAGHLDTCMRAGAEGIEIFAARNHFDFTNRSQVREIADWFRSNPLVAWALHAPLRMDTENERGGAISINVVHAEKARRIEAMDEIKRALESAEQIPFRHLIVHLGEVGDAWNQRALEHSMTAVEHLRAFARPLGVKMLLENLSKNEVAQPDNLREIVSVGHFDDIDFCLDIGHAHLSDGILPAIEIFGDRLRSVHVHDNAGDRDAHLWPGDGAIDWPEAMHALAALSNPPAAVLEIHRELEGPTDAARDRLRKAFDFLEFAATQEQPEKDRAPGTR